MKNFKFLLLGTSLSCFPQLAYTQCVVTEDCAALGYTETSCPGNGVKCPFGNGWFCGGDEASICAENGFNSAWTGTGYSGGSGQPCGGKYKTCNCATNYTWNGSSCALSCSSSYKYTCTGTGYAGGAGTACGGKYTQCTCSNGYEWKDESCQKKITNGPDGNLYYCNGTVVGVKGPDMDFYISMKDLGQMNWKDANNACQNYNFCNNINGSLPTEDQLYTMILTNNKHTLSRLLPTNGGVELIDGYYWSSSYGGLINHVPSYAIMHMPDGGMGNRWGNYLDSYYVRCILTSW